MHSTEYSYSLLLVMKISNLFKIGSRSSAVCTLNFLLSETTAHNERRTEQKGPHLRSTKAVWGIPYIR